MTMTVEKMLAALVERIHEALSWREDEVGEVEFALVLLPVGGKKLRVYTSTNDKALEARLRKAIGDG